MERIAAVSTECLFAKRSVRQGVMDKRAASTLVNILKDCLTLSAVILIGATLTFLLGS